MKKEKCITRERNFFVWTLGKSFWGKTEGEHMERAWELFHRGWLAVGEPTDLRNGSPERGEFLFYVLGLWGLNGLEGELVALFVGRQLWSRALRRTRPRSLEDLGCWALQQGGKKNMQQGLLLTGRRWTREKKGQFQLRFTWSSFLALSFLHPCSLARVVFLVLICMF